MSTYQANCENKSHQLKIQKYNYNDCSMKAIDGTGSER